MSHNKFQFIEHLTRYRNNIPSENSSVRVVFDLAVTRIYGKDEN